MKDAIFKKRKFTGDFKVVKKLLDADDLREGLAIKRERSLFGDLYHQQDFDMIDVVITDIEPFSENVKRYSFVPFEEELPLFEAGQSVCVFLRINGGRFLKPLAVCSSPNQRYYSVIVVRDDFVSDRMLDDWIVGSTVSITRPRGGFTYHPLRDEKNVLAFADSSGIAHFISMAEAIVDGKEDFNLTIVYTVKYYKDIIFKQYLNWLEHNSNGKVKFLYLLGEDTHVGTRHGLITSSFIKSIMEPPYSVFAAGTKEMIERLETHLAKLGVDKKHYHKRVPFVYANNQIDESKPYAKSKKFYLTVVSAGATYPPVAIERGDTLMVAMEKVGLNIPGKCMTGECGMCRSRLLEGKIEMINDEKRDVIDEKYSYVHPCMCYALSDVTIEIPIKRNEI